MLRFYLYFNALLYLVFALWCTLAPATTAANVGFIGLSSSGWSEYLVVYGGMELGLAAFFFFCAHRGDERAGLRFALAIYAPIVVFRSTTLYVRWPVAAPTLAIAALEILLLAAALALWSRRTKARVR